jgi:hypothetical protein
MFRSFLRSLSNRPAPRTLRTGTTLGIESLEDRQLPSPFPTLVPPPVQPPVASPSVGILATDDVATMGIMRKH